MKSVVLGLSGGVDSCACALILKEKGYDVTALYFDVLKEGNKEAELRARRAADKLGIGFIYKNVADEFENTIIKYFCESYAIGRTPSPCVLCNPLIKFKLLCDEGSDYIASGHYARILENEGIYYVRQAANVIKDQSYMLSRLPQDILSKLLLPLGEINSKDETRAVAKQLDEEISEIKDSQDICFLSGDYRDFLKDRKIFGASGDFYTSEGINKGPHKGTAFYTLGQRKGLGIALGEPAFVSRIDAKNGNVVLTTHEEDLFRKNVEIANIVYTRKPLENTKYFAKLRYSAGFAECRVKITDNKAVLSFEKAQRAPTNGQAAVIYDGDLVIASGIIENSF